MEHNKYLAYLSPNNFRADILAGITVGLALIPEAIGFSFIAKVDPIVGLYAAFTVCFIASLLGGRPGMISGATGPLAVVMAALVVTHGAQYLFAAVILMGALQLLVWMLRLGKFSRMIPHSVLLGFVNGLAIIIFFAQMPQFQSFTPDGRWGWIEGTWLPPEHLWPMLGLVALTMAIIYLFPKLTRMVPSSLVAIIVVSSITIAFGMDTPTVANILKGGMLPDTLPTFQLPQVPYNLETFWVILPYAVTFALVGLVDSLMVMSVVDQLTSSRGRSDRECLGQGVANIVTGFIGGMGGCGMLGQSVINYKSDGRGRFSGMTAGVSLMLFILFGGELIAMIPLAALVGVMFMVVYGTFAWATFKMMKRIPRADAFVIVLVALIVIFEDLATAVFAGIIVSALVFSWQKAQKMTVSTFVDENRLKHYELSGYLFFASAKSFVDLFSIEEDTDEVFIDFAHARVLDHSGIEAINALTERYSRAGKRLHLYHLSADCRMLIKNAEEIVEVNIHEDPIYEVADNALDS